MSRETTDPNDPGLGHGSDDAAVPQNDAYLVLSAQEASRGFTRPYRESYRHLVCGSITTMSRGIAETYARSPEFYGATYCCYCYRHSPVTEFVWDDDGTQVGT